MRRELFTDVVEKDGRWYAVVWTPGLNEVYCAEAGDGSQAGAAAITTGFENNLNAVPYEWDEARNDLLLPGVGPVPEAALPVGE